MCMAFSRCFSFIFGEHENIALLADLYLTLMVTSLLQHIQYVNHLDIFTL